MADRVKSFPWAPGTATGIGSHPGDDPDEAVRVAFEDAPELPYLPELPARGPGADMLGRSAALLAELPVELQPSGWRLADRPGRDLRRARSLLARDLDALEEYAGEYTGVVKLQAAGPWTLAGGIELPYGDKILADAGAVRDLTASLAEGLTVHVGEVRRRVPGARLVLQLDEPNLPAAVTGTVPTASGFSMLRPVDGSVAAAGLRTVFDAVSDVAYPLVHCGAREVPASLLRAAGAAAVSLDLLVADLRPVEEELAEAIEAGMAVLAGVVAAVDGGPDVSGPRATVEPIRELWARLGLDRELLRAVVVTPTRGLAGASPTYVRAALARCREAARLLAEESQ